MKKIKHLIVCGLCLLLVVGCKKDEKPVDTANQKVREMENDNFKEHDEWPPFDEVVAVEEETEGTIKAFVVVNPTAGNQVSGVVSFSQVEGGMLVTADIRGLTPGKHGFHIHEHGDCSAADGSSAGGHFNPLNKPHGGPVSKERHMGDLGNLEANELGFAHYKGTFQDLTTDGEYSIIGKSIIIHADEDDLESQPTGNAGKRIACGEILEAR